MTWTCDSCDRSRLILWRPRPPASSRPGPADDASGWLVTGAAEHCGMAQKPTHFTAYSNDETHPRFKAAVAQVGQRVDAREDRVSDVRLTASGLAIAFPKCASRQSHR